jgi:hypothetical protein
MNKFQSVLTGETPEDVFLGFAFFAILGIALSLLWHTTKREPLSTTTPVKFNWFFLFRDNAKRIAASILTVYVCLRFTPEILNVQLNDFWAFAIGLGFDKLAEFIKEKTSLLDVKHKNKT